MPSFLMSSWIPPGISLLVAPDPCRRLDTWPDNREAPSPDKALDETLDTTPDGVLDSKELEESFPGCAETDAVKGITYSHIAQHFILVHLFSGNPWCSRFSDWFWLSKYNENMLRTYLPTVNISFTSEFSMVGMICVLNLYNHSCNTWLLFTSNRFDGELFSRFYMTYSC